MASTQDARQGVATPPVADLGRQRLEVAVQAELGGGVQRLPGAGDAAGHAGDHQYAPPPPLQHRLRRHNAIEWWSGLAGGITAGLAQRYDARLSAGQQKVVNCSRSHRQGGAGERDGRQRVEPQHCISHLGCRLLRQRVLTAAWVHTHT